MNKIKLLLGLSFSLLLAGGAATAQETSGNRPPVPQATFFDTLQSYFSSFNTGLDTFQTDRVNISLGMDNVNNDDITASYLVEGYVYRLPDGGGLSLEANFRNEAIVGTIASAQGGAGWSWVKYDVKLTAYVDGGYQFNGQERGYIAIGSRVKKALSANTYAGIGLELPFYFKKTGDLVPTLSIFTGFKF